MTIDDILKESGMTRSQLCAKYGIPYRTVQNWSLGIRKTPAYVLTLLSDIVILERRLKEYAEKECQLGREIPGRT